MLKLIFSVVLLLAVPAMIFAHGSDDHKAAMEEKLDSAKAETAADTTKVKKVEPGKADVKADTTKAKKEEPKIITTESGLRYIVLAVGDGAEVVKGKKVECDYTGWLDDNGKPGKKFDSSIGKQPIGFVAAGGRMIKGWDEGVMGMKVGGKRRLFIPSTLGYGARAKGNLIPANSNLIFDVEIVSVK